jgi:hypothetical protein
MHTQTHDVSHHDNGFCVARSCNFCLRTSYTTYNHHTGISPSSSDYSNQVQEDGVALTTSNKRMSCKRLTIIPRFDASETSAM